MPETLEARLRKDIAHREELHRRIDTLSKEEAHLRQALERLGEKRQAAEEQQRQLPAEEDLYWRHLKENAAQLQERSKAVAGWKSTAAEDEQLIRLYDENQNLAIVASSLKAAYEAAVQRKKAIEEPVVAEIALRMVPYGDGESYLLTLPVPLDAEEGLAGALRSYVLDVFEQNTITQKNFRKQGLQSYILLSVNPKCHPKKLEELLSNLQLYVSPELQEANVQVVVSDVRALLQASTPDQETRESALAREKTPETERYIPMTDPEIYEITGLQRTSLDRHLSVHNGQIDTKHIYDPAIGKDRVYVSVASLEAFVKRRGGKGKFLSLLRDRAPEGYVHISDPCVKELTGHEARSAIYTLIDGGALKVMRDVSPGKHRGFVYIERESLEAFAKSQGRAVPDEAEQQPSYHTIDEVFGDRERLTFKEGAALLGWGASTFYRKGEEAYIDCKGGPIKTLVGEAAQGKIAGLRLRSDARLLDRDSLLQFAKKQKIPANELYTEQEAVKYLFRTVTDSKTLSTGNRIPTPEELIQALYRDVRTLIGRDGEKYYSLPVLSAVLQEACSEAYQ